MQDEEIVQNEELIDDVEFVDANEDGDELSAKDKIKQLRDKLKVSEKERMEYLTGWQRAKADYVNLQKEEEGKRKELRAYITTQIVEDLLPTLDAFDVAMGNKEAWEKVDANWRAGVEYIYQQILKTLEGYNVTKIGKIGEAFDHNIHESIETVPVDDSNLDHTIASITQYGYKIGDKVIRPARVKVYSK